MTQIADNHDLNHHGNAARRYQLFVERIELIGPGCRYRERDRIECPRATALGLDICIGQPGRVAIKDSAYRRCIIRCRAAHHFNGIATREFNLRCFLFCHDLTKQVLEPQNQRIHQTLEEPTNWHILQNQQRGFKQYLTAPKDLHTTNDITTTKRRL